MLLYTAVSPYDIMSAEWKYENKEFMPIAKMTAVNIYDEVKSFENDLSTDPYKYVERLKSNRMII